MEQTIQDLIDSGELDFVSFNSWRPMAELEGLTPQEIAQKIQSAVFLSPNGRDLRHVAKSAGFGG